MDAKNNTITFREIFRIRKNSVYIFLALLWATPVLSLLTQIVAHLPIINSFSDLVIPFVLVPLFLLSLRQIGSKLKPSLLFFYIFLSIYYVFSYWAFPENDTFLEERALSYFVYSLPFFYVGYLSCDDDCLDWFYYASYISVISSVFYNLFYITASDYQGEAEIIESNMAAAYSLLPHLLMVVWRTLSKPSIASFVFNIPVFLLGFFLLITFGSRGPIICFLLFVFLYFFVFKSFKRPVFTRIMILLVGLFVFKLFPSAMVFLLNTATDFGMGTRVINYLIEGGFISDSSGRDFIVNTIWPQLSIFPHGMGGAFPIVHTYSHNLAIDFWLDFGVILGTVLLLWIISMIILTYKRLKGLALNEFFCILFVCGFVSLFLSKSYLSEPLFYYLLGFCAYVCKKNRVTV